MCIRVLCAVLLLSLFSACGSSSDSSVEDCYLSAEAQCGESEFCQFAVGNCGLDDQIGKCEQLPEVCELLFAPVCGCDGITYSNSCVAALSGVSILSDGSCAE